MLRDELCLRLVGFLWAAGEGRRKPNRKTCYTNGKGTGQRGLSALRLGHSQLAAHYEYQS